MESAISPAPLNLSAASAAAIADLQSAAPTPDPAPAPEAPVESAAPEAEASAAPDEPTPESVDADPQAEEATPDKVEAKRKWQFKAGGKEVELDEDDLIRSAQKGIDYEQKTQRLAAEAKNIQQLHSQLVERQKLLTNVARDPRLFDEYRKYVQQAYGLPDDPNEIISAEQALKMAQAQTEHALAEFRAEQERKDFDREVDTLTVNYEQAVTKHANSLLAKYPDLDTYEDLVAVLKLDVSKELAKQSEPTEDISEVLKLMDKAAERRNTAIVKKLDNHTKMVAVRAAKATKAAPAPPGGTGPRPAPVNTAGMKLGSKELTASVVAELQEAFSKKS